MLGIVLLTLQPIALIVYLMVGLGCSTFVAAAMALRMA